MNITPPTGKASIATQLEELSVAVREAFERARAKSPEERDREIRRRLAAAARDLRRAAIPAAVLQALSLEQLRQIDRMVADLRAAATRQEPFV